MLIKTITSNLFSKIKSAETSLGYGEYFKFPDYLQLTVYFGNVLNEFYSIRSLSGVEGP